MTDTQSKGLTCPACASAVPVPEGARLVTCPACRQRLFVQGDRGVRRWQLRRVVTRDQVQQTVTSFFSGMNKAGNLKRQAEIKELFLAYLPFWRMMAYVAGWRLGRVRRDKDSTKPIEVEILEEMQWNDAAVDVSEFGVNRVPIAGKNFEPFDQDRLSAEGMIFEATESPTDATQWLLDEQHIAPENIREASLVHLPVFVCKYAFNKRRYTAMVDAATSKVFANIYPAKWEVPYVAIGVAAFAAFFVLSLLSLFINFGLFVIGAPLLAILFFVLAVSISAKV